MSISERVWMTVSVIVGRFEDRKNDKGITAIEYALMAAAIAGVIVAAMAVLGDKIEALFNDINVTGGTTN